MATSPIAQTHRFDSRDHAASRLVFRLLPSQISELSSQYRSATLRLLGFTFLWTWMHASFFSLTLFPKQATAGEILRFAQVSTAANALTMVAVVLLAGAASRLVNHPLVLLCSSAVMAAGTLMAALSWHSAEPVQPLLLAGAALTGIGSAYQWLCWGEAYSAVPTRVSELFTPLSVVLGSMLYVGLSALPATLALTAGLVLPFASALAIPARLAANAPASHGSGQVERTQWRPLLRLAALVAVYSAAFGLIRSVGTSAYDTGVPSLGTFVTLTCGAIALLLFAVLARFPKRVRWTSGYRVVLPVMLAGLLLVPSLGSSYSTLAGATARVGYTCFYILLWVTCSDMCSRFSISPHRAFGVQQGASFAGLFLGISLGWLFVGKVDLPQTSLATVQLAVVFSLVLVFMLFLGRRDALIPLGFEEALLDGQDFAAQHEGHRSRWIERCDETARLHGLTPREHEIMIMLVKGRSMPYIHSELMISSGTVKTHVRNLYRKLGVHSRQELISLIEPSRSDEHAGL